MALCCARADAHRARPADIAQLRIFVIINHKIVVKISILHNGSSLYDFSEIFIS